MAADRVVLPGVGAFGNAAHRLRELRLDEVERGFIESERPFLGNCVGMQLLMEKGLEFGEHDGLGFFEGTVEKIALADEDGSPLRVPVIGCNTPFAPGAGGDWGDTAFSGTRPGSAFYFVHSYAVQASNAQDILAIVSVGTGAVTAAIDRDNIYGVQFYPERSSNTGPAFLNGFLSV